MMLPRSALVLSRRRLSIGIVPRQASNPQIFPSICHRREFSSASSQNASPRPGTTSKSTGTGKTLSKFFLGVLQLTAQVLRNCRRGEDSGTLNSHQSAKDPVGNSGKFGGRSDSFAKNSSNSQEAATHAKEEDLPKDSDDVFANGEQLPKFSSEETAKDEYPSSQESLDKSADMNSVGENSHAERYEADKNLPTITDVGAVVQKKDTAKDECEELKLQNEPKNIISSEQEQSSSLDTYHLEDKVNDGATTISGDITKISSPTKETSPGALGDAYVSGDGKLILDFLQAIHAAEQRQAELDAHVFSEEKRAMKLKDARARELMYAEEAAMLEKEVKKERAKAAAALNHFRKGLKRG
ncbi:A disintegrin and metalloproteinase with thrombospondin motifs 4 [Bienertia sinuspersici]